MSLQKPQVYPLVATDGITVQVARFDPTGTPNGAIHVLHGFGEHSGRYHEFADFFTKNGYVCIIHDQRGHGEMPGMSEYKRERSFGISNKYDCFLDDVSAVRTQIATWYPNLPVILYGHSLGGNIAINYLLRRSQPEYTKVVLETPWLRLNKPKSKLIVFVSRLLGKISHNFAIIDEKLDIDSISRDKERVAEIKNDPYFHSRMSLRIFAQITDAGEYCISNASKLSLPILLLGAEDDTIVSTEAINEFAKVAGIKGNLHIEPQGRHSLHNDSEPTKSEILQRVLAFLNA